MTHESNLPNTNHSVIVVGVDFSEASAGALKEAAAMAERAAVSELHVVHVVALPAGTPALGVAAMPELAYSEDIDESDKTLEAWLAPLRLGHTRVARHFRAGSPDREIAQVASDVGADLIVVGTTGKKGVARLVLGSVAESLVRSAPCPVLVYRPRTTPAWELIEPPCVDCVAVRGVTSRASLWCERHSQHHIRAHTYRETPPSYGIGAQTFRS